MQNLTRHCLYSLSLSRSIIFAMLVVLNSLIPQSQAAGDFMLLGDLSNDNFGNAYSVNADGSVVVGDSNRAIGGNGNSEAFRWTQADGMVGLGTLPGVIRGFSIAKGVNADGSVVVGDSYSTNGLEREAFRWTQADGMVGLGTLLRGGYSSANAVNADGSVVVGVSNGPNGLEAFRWTQADGIVGLGALSEGGSSNAKGVNADGSVVVGQNLGQNGIVAFRWTQADGMVSLGALSEGDFSIANGVNADGSVVVGQNYGPNGFEAFRWTQADGMVSVADWLTAAGVAITPGYAIENANGVSADGNVVVGSAVRNFGVEVYLARVSPIGSGVINPVTNTQSVIETGARALQVATTLPNMVLFGAHHRTILDDGLVKTANSQDCAWATGDFGRNNESQAKMGTAEMGVCKDIGSARIGVGFGLDWAKQNLNFDGKASYSGQHVLVEAANAFENGLQPSVLAYYGRYDAEVTRQYQNAGNIDSSFGTTEASSKAIRLRLDWKDIVHIGNSSVTPYAAYTWMRTSIDGYTESGGGFPVEFNDNRWTTNDVRLGAATYFSLNTQTNLRIAAEAVHRFEDNTASGRVLGLNSFNYIGKDIKQNWVRANMDVDHRFTDDMLLTVGLNLGTGGGDNNWGLTAGLRANY